jgi:arylsulfatase A-like enzyme
MEPGLENHVIDPDGRTPGPGRLGRTTAETVDWPGRALVFRAPAGTIRDVASAREYRTTIDRPIRIAGQSSRQFTATRADPTHDVDGDDPGPPGQTPPMRTPLLMLLALGVPFCILPGLASAAAARQPNILVILSDDVGWGEYGFQGATDTPTPHIDSIARSGIRFTQGYVSGPYCSPTRAGLMTGHYQTRFGHEFNSVGDRLGLVLSETTFAARLKALGYATCAVGKWHLGGRPDYRPMRRGFDEYFGSLNNVNSYYHPGGFVDSRVSDDPRVVAEDGFYTTEAYAKRAVDWIEHHQDGPWFLYLATNAQHVPMDAPQKYLDRFPDIADENRRIFAAMMSALDDAVGRVLEKIRALGQEENTLIFFLSDNGGPTRQTTSNNRPLRGFKATTWEGGIRVPFCVQWKGTLPAGKTYEHPIIQLDIMPTVLAAAGAKIDPAWKLDGLDLRPYLTGERSDPPHETFYWRFGKQWAVRHGDWKLLVGNGGSGRPELYHLSQDIGETTDLAARNPEKVKELQGLYERWNAEQAEPLLPLETPGAAAKKAAAKKAANP